MNLPALTALRWIPACALLVACADTVAGVDGAVGPDRRDAGGDMADVVDGGGWPLPRDPRAPRLIAPLSSSYTTHRRPTLRWAPPAGTTGAIVEICRDRACTSVEERLEVEGGSARPTRELPPGSHFWRVTARDASSVGRERSATWVFRSPFVSSEADNSTGTFLDVNGDGRNDLVIRTQIEPSVAGPTLLYLANQDGLARESSSRLPSGLVSHVGDINGDGFTDLLWCVPVIDPALQPEARIFFGDSSGLSSESLALQLRGPLDGIYANSVGDVNGDGYGDLAVGGWWVQPPPGVSRSQTRIYLGGPDGVAENRTLDYSTQATGDDLLEGLRGEIGDFNGDRFNDLIQYTLPSPTLGVFRGGRSRPSTRSSFRLGAYERFYFNNGYGLEWLALSTTLCDINRDGLADIVSQMKSENGSERAGVYFGTRTPPSLIYATHEFTLSTVRGVRGITRFAQCMGDANGDSHSDVLLEDDETIRWAPGTGKGLGNWQQLDSLSDGSEPRAALGSGDINGDGFTDVLIVSSTAIQLRRGSMNGFGMPEEILQANEIRFGQGTSPRINVTGCIF